MFKRKPKTETKITLWNYPEKATLDSVIRTVDNTDLETDVKIICTLTQETLAERRRGRWKIFWSARSQLRLA